MPFKARTAVYCFNQHTCACNEVNDYVDVFDIEGCLEHYELSMSVMLYNILLGHLKDLKEEYQDKVKELKELDLSNL